MIMVIELDNTEEKIVEATFGILQKEGSKKATTKRIAAEAGVNEVTIFRKFESKKNLIKSRKSTMLLVLLGNWRIFSSLVMMMKLPTILVAVFIKF